MAYKHQPGGPAQFTQNGWSDWTPPPAQKAKSSMLTVATKVLFGIIILMSAVISYALVAI